MLVRSLLSSIAFVALALALSPQTSRAEECSASIAAFSAAGHGLSGKETMYRVTLDVEPDVTGAEFVIHGNSAPDTKLDEVVTHHRSSPVIVP
ncbi:MAG TPA: hypothetical protein VFO25_09740 [Candidatus Eremiobacteraceae bacterium]|nr:hypothetical protein [Candidatus Eremiobacteraceae bacterium]